MKKNITIVISLIYFVLATTHPMARQISTASALNKMQQEVLLAHNTLRGRHQAPRLTWDVTLERYAEHHASACQFRHSSSPYGENLAAGYPSITSAIQAWYAEQAQYSYSDPGFSSRTGHFTQLIWAGTKKIGCANVTCDGKSGTPGHYLVCEYSPAGNVTNDGYFRANVLPESKIVT